MLTKQHEKLSSRQLSKLSIDATGKLLSEELRALYGDTNRLEPELAEWFFGERATKITFVENAELREIEFILADENLPRSVVHHDDTLSVIAVSPLVNINEVRLKTTVS